MKAGVAEARRLRLAPCLLTRRLLGERAPSRTGVYSVVQPHQSGMWSVCGGDLTCGRRSSARNRIGGASRPQVQHASGGRRRPLLGLLLGLLAAIASHAGGRSTADGATREPVWTADHQAHLTHARGFRQVTLSGYSIGLGFPPGWGEPHVLSLKPNVHTVLDENMTLHIVPSLHIPGMTIFGLSETVRVTATGCEVIGDAVPVPRRMVIKPV